MAGIVQLASTNISYKLPSADELADLENELRPRFRAAELPFDDALLTPRYAPYLKAALSAGLLGVEEFRGWIDRRRDFLNLPLQEQKHRIAKNQQRLLRELGLVGDTATKAKKRWKPKRKDAPTEHRGEQSMWALPDARQTETLESWIAQYNRVVALASDLNEENNKTEGLYLSTSEMRDVKRFLTTQPDYAWLADIPHRLIHSATYQTVQRYMAYTKRDTKMLEKSKPPAFTFDRGLRLDGDRMTMEIPGLGTVKLQPVNPRQAHFIKTKNFTKVHLATLQRNQRWRVTLEFTRFEQRDLAAVLYAGFMETEFRSTEWLLAYLKQRGINLNQYTLQPYMDALGYVPSRQRHGAQKRGYAWTESVEFSL